MSGQDPDGQQNRPPQPYGPPHQYGSPQPGGPPEPYGPPRQYPQQQQYGPPRQYPQQGPWGPAGPPSRTNTMAILALVFAFVFFPLGIVFGFIARSQIRRTGEEGSGLALAGIITGFVVTAFVALYLVFAVVFFGVAVHEITHLSPSPFPSPFSTS